MKLLVNQVDDSDPKPHFTSIIAPLPVKSYYGLLTITTVNVNNTFSILRPTTNAILDMQLSKSQYTTCYTSLCL